jgi:hypothetical protein
MVELWGIEPHAAILRGWPADHSQSHGAQSWFRANLSASSARRCHQTSYPSARWRVAEIVSASRWTSRHHRKIGANGGNQTRVSALATLGSVIELRSHGGKWMELNLLPRRDRVYGAATAPARPYWHFPCASGLVPRVASAGA